MNKYDLQLLGIFIIGLLLTVSIVYIQDVFATGGAGIIAEKIMTQLQDALTYLNEGDNQAAAQEIENAINELKDTYESDKEE